MGRTIRGPDSEGPGSVRFLETAIAGVWIVEREPVVDERGHFARMFCAREFADHGLDPRLAQTSVSWNRPCGVLRGLHRQIEPRPEAKLVACLQGAVFDAAVDLRPASPTFGRWVTAQLTAEGTRMLYIPAGCAHGFQTLADNSVLLYHISEFYDSTLSVGVRWDDPDIGVPWPLPEQAIVSPRDRALPLLRDAVPR